MIPGNAAQEAPAAGEGVFRDTAVADHDDIRGVRMGAGERSYLVRDRRIDVLKNVHGGVQARRASPCLAPGLAEHACGHQTGAIKRWCISVYICTYIRHASDTNDFTLLWGTRHSPFIKCRRAAPWPRTTLAKFALALSVTSLCGWMLDLAWSVSLAMIMCDGLLGTDAVQAGSPSLGFKPGQASVLMARRQPSSQSA